MNDVAASPTHANGKAAAPAFAAGKDAEEETRRRRWEAEQEAIQTKIAASRREVEAVAQGRVKPPSREAAEMAEGFVTGLKELNELVQKIQAEEKRLEAARHEATALNSRLNTILQFYPGVGAEALSSPDVLKKTH